MNQKVDLWSKKQITHTRNVLMYEITDSLNIESRLEQIYREITLARKGEEIQSLVFFVPDKSSVMSCIKYIFEKFKGIDFEIINSGKIT